jgi:hypothetical protein
VGTAEASSSSRSLLESHMVWGEGARRLLASRQARAGLGLLVLGESLIVIRVRPFSDFYFPFAWFGFIFFLDAAIRVQSGKSLLTSARPVFLALIPLSSLFWWLFEGFDLVVHNWSYVGGAQYTAVGFVAFASMDFSTVLLAVWCGAALIRLLIPGRDREAILTVPGVVLAIVFVAGLLCLVLPFAFSRYAFGLIWGCTAMILDPINAYLGRPSMLRALRNRCWRLPVSFALGGLLCGVFWEAWNFWSLPKWIYTVPYVNFGHIFEMPLLGYGGYLPFGLEVFTMVNFVLPLIRLGTLTLDADDTVTGPARPVGYRTWIRTKARANS